MQGALSLQPGSILISAPLLDDPNFEKVVIFIAEHNEKGALGFVVNQLFSRRFNELIEFRHCAAFPLFEGGPVETESLYFIHQRPDLIENSLPVVGAVCLGGNFKQAVAYMNDASLAETEIKLFIGYCGWDDQQLEEEIAEGSWLLADATVEIIFFVDTDILWEELYKRKQ